MRYESVFIAVRQYKSLLFQCDIEKISIFDSDDLTVESVSINDIINSGIEFKNFDVNKMKIVLPDFIKIMQRNNLFNVERIGDSNFSFCVNGISIFLENGFPQPIRINRVIPGKFYFYPSDLQYFFRFRDYIVLRFSGNTDVWFSVAINNAGELSAYWLDDFSAVHNKELAQKIDMLCEV